MKQISFDHLQQPQQPPRRAPRNQREDLVQQIVAQTNEKDKAGLERRLMIAANAGDWSVTDLHALLKKRNDPAIRNYSAYVKWCAKITKRG